MVVTSAGTRPPRPAHRPAATHRIAACRRVAPWVVRYAGVHRRRAFARETMRSRAPPPGDSPHARDSRIRRRLQATPPRAGRLRASAQPPYDAPDGRCRRPRVASALAALLALPARRTTNPVG